MANADTPFGLRAVGHPLGLSKASVRAYHVPASYGTALFPGDPVTISGTANTAEVSAPGVGTMPIGALPDVVKSTAGSGNRISGVIVSVAADPDALGRRYIPASTGGVVFVNDDPATEFEIQSDAALAAADVGLNAALVYTNAGDANTGQSGAELDASTKATTAGLQLRIKRIVPRVDNEAGASEVKAIVTINQHTSLIGSAGI
jgi:hypothetical protein